MVLHRFHLRPSPSDVVVKQKVLRFSWWKNQLILKRENPDRFSAPHCPWYGLSLSAVVINISKAAVRTNFGIEPVISGTFVFLGMAQFSFPGRTLFAQVLAKVRKIKRLQRKLIVFSWPVCTCSGTQWDGMFSLTSYPSSNEFKTWISSASTHWRGYYEYENTHQIHGNWFSFVCISI